MSEIPPFEVSLWVQPFFSGSAFFIPTELEDRYELRQHRPEVSIFEQSGQFDHPAIAEESIPKLRATVTTTSEIQFSVYRDQKRVTAQFAYNVSPFSVQVLLVPDTNLAYVAFNQLPTLCTILSPEEGKNDTWNETASKHGTGRIRARFLLPSSTDAWPDKRPKFTSKAPGPTRGHRS